MADECGWRIFFEPSSLGIISSFAIRHSSLFMNVVITGSSSGIGQFLAESLAGKGHAVCRLARSAQDGFSFQCDVSDWNAVQHCAGKISAKWNSLDALICCAGIQEPIGPAMEIDPLAWRKNLAVNLDGTDRKSTRLNSSHRH